MRGNRRDPELIHPRSKIKTSQVPIIRSDPRLHKIIAYDYGVNPSVISKLKRRVTYAKT